MPVSVFTGEKVRNCIVGDLIGLAPFMNIEKKGNEKMYVIKGEKSSEVKES